MTRRSPAYEPLVNALKRLEYNRAMAALRIVEGTARQALEQHEDRVAAAVTLDDETLQTDASSLLTALAGFSPREVVLALADLLEGFAVGMEAATPTKAEETRTHAAQLR